MKKKLTLMALLLVFATATWAQTATQRLVVWQKSGEKVYFDLNEEPETTFEDGLLIIKTANGSSVEFHLENIVRYTYEGAHTSIDLMPAERSVSISNEGDAVVLKNLRDGQTVSLYATNGTLLEQRKAIGGVTLTISVSNRPAGVYIVKAGSETIKLMKQ